MRSLGTSVADEIFPIDIPIGVGAMRPNSQYARPGIGNSAGVLS
jgi:hypothetical protein